MNSNRFPLLSTLKEFRAKNQCARAFGFKVEDFKNLKP